MNSTFLSLGSNLGNRIAHFTLAETLISEQIGKVVKTSSVYETEPWGYTNQPAFLNKVIKVETWLNPTELLKTILAIEIRMGRVRTDKWHERIIDIDILFFNDLILKEDNIEVPHPYIQNRMFVLIPLAEIANSLMHPILNKTIDTLLSACDDVLIAKKYP